MTQNANKVAAVTGGSAGIGKVICEQLLEQGYEVISLSRRSADIQHPKLHNIEVDLTDRAATAEAVATMVKQHEVTTVVHNAGVIRAALLPEVKLSDLDALVDLHLGCAIQMVQAALPAMRARHFGRVVLLSSRAALGLQTRTSYSATKAGMLGMARTWALELAPEGITVNVVAPGPIRTDMFYDVVQQGSDKEKALAASVPVRRLGDLLNHGRAFIAAVDAGTTANLHPSDNGAAVGVEGLRQLGLEALPWDRRSRGLQQRLALAHVHLGAPWPDRRPEALERLEAVIDTFDGMMVARGDLGEAPHRDPAVVGAADPAAVLAEVEVPLAAGDAAKRRERPFDLAHAPGAMHSRHGQSGVG